MMDILKVALRNIGRNRRRTIITVFIVFLGVVVSTATRGLLDGLQDEIRSNLTRKMHGDLQVHKRGYQDSLESQPYKLLIPIEAEHSGFQQAARLKLMALLNHQGSQTTTPVMITGIDSKSEERVCPRFATAIQEGKMLDSNLEKAPENEIDSELGEASGLNDTASTLLAPTKAEGYQQIMLTPSLMRGLNAKIGDELIVLIQDKDNMQQAIITRLVGVIEMGVPGAAARMAWMDLNSLQRTLSIPGLASEFAFRIPEEENLESARTKLQGLVGDDLHVETWKDLGGFLRDAMALQDLIFSAVVIILFSIVIAAIINTSLMTVMERTREIGTLMALGYRRVHILSMFLAESAFIGVFGGLSGVTVAVGLVSFLHIKGIHFTLPGQSVATILYPTLSLGFLALIFILSIAAALIAGFVPAYRASHLKPVEALSAT